MDVYGPAVNCGKNEFDIHPFIRNPNFTSFSNKIFGFSSEKSQQLKM